MSGVIVCPTCDGHPKRLNLRVEGGSLSCQFCNRTLTFNFIRDQEEGTDRRCSCRKSREAECPTCLGEATIPAPTPATPAAPPTAGEVPEELRGLLAKVLAFFDADEGCRLDHNGTCQAHMLEGADEGCSIAALRSLLTPEATGEPT